MNSKKRISNLREHRIVLKGIINESQTLELKNVRNELHENKERDNKLTQKIEEIESEVEKLTERRRELQSLVDIENSKFDKLKEIQEADNCEDKLSKIQEADNCEDKESFIEKQRKNDNYAELRLSV